MVKNQRNLLNYREQILLYILAPNLLQLQFYSLITDNCLSRFANVENVLGSICHSWLLRRTFIYKTEKD